jgi:hypothetical protein
MNPRRLFPLLCLLLTACSSSEVLTSSQPMGIKSVSIEEITDNHAVGTFETYEMCKDAKLSEADVREFFEKSRPISGEDRRRLEYEGRSSICETWGTVEWENGERTHWSINRARTALFYFDPPNCDGVWRYCDTCDNEHRYYIEPRDLEQFRPKVKTVTIIGHGEPTESCQKEFTLTPDDVRDFFDVAKSTTLFIDIDFSDIDNTRDLEQCNLIGKAVLQDGQEAYWWIDRFRRAYLGTAEGENSRYFYYYCADCQSEKYSAPCDADCLEALNKAEEGLVACPTDTDIAIDDTQAIPVPAIKNVIFDANGNPFTVPDPYEPEKEIDPDLCEGFTLTEADVLEFFRDARRSNAMEYHEFIASRCRVSGDVILVDGRKAVFEIDRNRQGWMALDRETTLRFYCATCKGTGYFEACDIDCLRDDD